MLAVGADIGFVQQTVALRLLRGNMHTKREFVFILIQIPCVQMQDSRFAFSAEILCNARLHVFRRRAVPDAGCQKIQHAQTGARIGRARQREQQRRQHHCPADGDPGHSGILLLLQGSQRVFHPEMKALRGRLVRILPMLDLFSGHFSAPFHERP